MVLVDGVQSVPDDLGTGWLVLQLPLGGAAEADIVAGLGEGRTVVLGLGGFVGIAVGGEVAQEAHPVLGDAVSVAHGGVYNPLARLGGGVLEPVEQLLDSPHILN